MQPTGSQHELIQSIDGLIRAGQLSAAKTQLLSIEIKKVERADVLGFASLARRLGLFTLALRLLTPIIHSQKPVDGTATSDEELEYATALMKIGANAAARKYFARINPATHPDALLYLAMSYVGEWDYHIAIPYLRRFIESGISDYKKTVGQVNLAAALIHEDQFKEASELLSELLDRTRSPEFGLLRANCLELSAQLEVEQRNFTVADRCLQAAAQALRGSQTLPELLIRKWAMINDAYRFGKLPDGWRQLRAEAAEKRIWEVVRDLDARAGFIEKDRNLLLRVYFGTPFASYRNKMERVSPVDLRLPEKYLFGETTDQAPSDVLDLELAAIAGKESQMSVGSQLHGFLILLVRDFYRPLDAVMAASLLSPQEYFNPETTPAKVHQLARRLRQWIKTSDLPLSLENVEGDYRLLTQGSFAIEIPRDLPVPERHELMCRKLRRLFGDQVFSAKEARMQLEISTGWMNELIVWAESQDRLVRMGSGSKTRYQLRSRVIDAAEPSKA